jgi:hypothetical protein
MGRGRAKAKQTKVARDLKYRAIDTDFVSLERELRGESYDSFDPPVIEVVEEEPDEWADLAAKYDPDYVEDSADVGEIAR